jgi:hypothetical protein
MASQSRKKDEIQPVPLVFAKKKKEVAPTFRARARCERKYRFFIERYMYLASS